MLSKNQSPRALNPSEYTPQNTSCKLAPNKFSSTMSASMSLDEKFDALMGQNERLTKKINEDTQRDQETKVQNDYLRRHPGAFLK